MPFAFYLSSSSMSTQDPSNKFSTLFDPLKFEPPSARIKLDDEELKKYVEKKRNFKNYTEEDLVKEIFLLLEKAIKISHTYHFRHPIYQKFMDLLQWSFEACHAYIDPITLQIGQFEILFKDQVVYQNSNQSTSLAFKLFKDGVTYLSFYKGLTQEEIIKFVDILARDFRAENEEDDDLITLLWEKDFEHIVYQVVERFAELELEDTEEYKAFIEKLNKEEATPGGPESRRDLTSEEPKEGTFSEINLILEHGLSLEAALDLKKEDLIPLFSSDLEELKKIKEQLDHEDTQDLVYKMTTILFEVLHLRKNLSEFGELLNVLEKIFESLVSNGNFFSATEILQNLKAIQRSEGFSSEYLNLIADFLDRVGGRNGIQRIEKGMKYIQPDRLGLVFDFLTHLNDNAILFLCDLLGKVSDANVQKTLYQAILALGQKNIPMLMTVLETGSLPITHEVLSFILKAGTGEEWGRLKEMTSHKNPKVRESLAVALGKILQPESGSVLLKLLEDPHPEVRNRALTSLYNFRPSGSSEQALGAPKGSASDKIVAGLLKIAIQEDFNDKPFAEKKEFFKLLGALGSLQAVPVLRKILQKEEGWLNPGRYDELRACAALALGMLGTQDAREALMEGVKSKRKVVKTFCEEALKVLGGKTK